VAASSGDVGAERNWIAVRLPIAGDANASARAPGQRTSLTHVEAGYFYNLKCPLGTACGRVLLDFGQVKRRDGYSSLCVVKWIRPNLSADVWPLR